MAEVSPREWSIQYEALKKRIQNLRINSSEFSTQDIKQFNSGISILENQLRQMNDSPMKYEIVASELARRQVLIENLKKLLTNGTIKEKNPSVNSSNGSTKTTNFNPMNTSERGLVQRQQDVIKLQDDMILEIESGVGRLHDKALAIGDETKSHGRLLDDLDSNVDIATAALQAEAKHAERIKDKAKVCWMYICILVEVLVLILLLILAFST